MDKSSIKEDGILEQYLLGELSAAENAEVEHALKEDEELRGYFTELENDFERMAFENAIDPPASVKKSLLNTVVNAKHEKVIPLTTKGQNPYKFMVAASLAAIFMLSSFWLYNSWQTARQEMQVLREETSDLQDRLVGLEKDLKDTEKWYQAINQPNVRQLVLIGNDLLPDAKAIAYVNHETKNVIVNPKALPSLAADKTYQMWADVEGEMIDMGVIPANNEMIAMKYIDHAESLNITIEPAGGNDHPTVEQLIANVFL